MALFSARNARVIVTDVGNNADTYDTVGGTAKELFGSKWTLNVRVDTIETSNFTTNGYSSYIPGLRDSDGAVDGYWDSTFFPTGNPPCIYPGAVRRLLLYVSRPAADAGVPACANTAQPNLVWYWLFPAALITEVDAMAEVRGLMRYDFKFRNQGPFEAPGQNGH